MHAVLKLDNSVLANIAALAYDKHSHACSMALLMSKELAGKLHELGYCRDAVVLRTVGRAWQAWNRPHLTQEGRTKVMFLLATLVYQAFGFDLWDVRVLTASHYGNIPINQVN